LQDMNRPTALEGLDGGQIDQVLAYRTGLVTHGPRARPRLEGAPPLGFISDEELFHPALVARAYHRDQIGRDPSVAGPLMIARHGRSLGGLQMPAHDLPPSRAERLRGLQLGIAG